MYLLEGEEYSKEKTGLWLDYYLAKNIGIKVGDELYEVAVGIIAVITLVTYLSCRKILKEPAATLLRIVNQFLSKKCLQNMKIVL